MYMYSASIAKILSLLSASRSMLRLGMVLEFFSH